MQSPRPWERTPAGGGGGGGGAGGGGQANELANELAGLTTSSW